MSFAAEVKNELARLHTEKSCCQLAELTALMRMGGTMLIGGRNQLGVNFTTENAAVARKVVTLIKSGFDVKIQIMVSRGRRLKKNNIYVIRVLPSPVVTELLATLGIINGDRTIARTDVGLLRKACCRRAYLRGAFLGGGSVNRPEGEYHLELVTGNIDFAKTLLRVMKTFRIPARLTDRKQDYVVYIKEGDAITTFLQMIGAHGALLAFENVRVVKDVRNRVNRLVNCETANLQKTVDAAIRQIENINLIAEKVGLENLPPALREVAELRLSHPHATLQELVQIMDGKITKSGIYHRFRKLEQIAGELAQPQEQ